MKTIELNLHFQINLRLQRIIWLMLHAKETTRMHSQPPLDGIPFLRAILKE